MILTPVRGLIARESEKETVFFCFNHDLINKAGCVCVCMGFMALISTLVLCARSQDLSMSLSVCKGGNNVCIFVHTIVIDALSLQRPSARSR